MDKTLILNSDKQVNFHNNDFREASLVIIDYGENFQVAKARNKFYDDKVKYPIAKLDSFIKEYYNLLTNIINE